MSTSGRCASRRAGPVGARQPEPGSMSAPEKTRRMARVAQPSPGGFALPRDNDEVDRKDVFHVFCGLEVYIFEHFHRRR